MNLRDTPAYSQDITLVQATLFPMVQNRAWGTVQNPVPATYRIARASRDRLLELAHAAGVTGPAFLEALIARVECDENGVPVWAHELHDTSEELPIDKAA